MTWNYRIIYHDKAKHPYFAVHEVFYDGLGEITNWTSDPIDIVGDSQEEVIRTLRQMLFDTKAVVLLESKLERAIHAIL